MGAGSRRRVPERGTRDAGVVLELATEQRPSGVVRAVGIAGAGALGERAQLADTIDGCSDGGGERLHSSAADAPGEAAAVSRSRHSELQRRSAAVGAGEAVRRREAKVAQRRLVRHVQQEPALAAERAQQATAPDGRVHRIGLLLVRREHERVGDAHGKQSGVRPVQLIEKARPRRLARAQLLRGGEQHAMRHAAPRIRVERRRRRFGGAHHDGLRARVARRLRPHTGEVPRAHYEDAAALGMVRKQERCTGRHS